jgi:rare lipoprotein A
MYRGLLAVCAFALILATLGVADAFGHSEVRASTLPEGLLAQGTHVTPETFHIVRDWDWWVVDVGSSVSESVGIVSELTKTSVAVIAKQTSGLASLMTMVYTEPSALTGWLFANSTLPILSAGHLVKLFFGEAVSILELGGITYLAGSFLVCVSVGFLLHLNTPLTLPRISIRRNIAPVKLRGRFQLSTVGTSLRLCSKRAFRCVLFLLGVPLSYVRPAIFGVCKRHLAIIAVLAIGVQPLFSTPVQAMTYYGIDDGYTWGDITASGQAFDPYGQTAAHPTLPFGTVVPACGPSGCVDVTINDRCACDLDVTKGVAQEIGMI